MSTENWLPFVVLILASLIATFQLLEFIFHKRSEVRFQAFMGWTVAAIMASVIVWGK